MSPSGKFYVAVSALNEKKRKTKYVAINEVVGASSFQESSPHWDELLGAELVQAITKTPSEIIYRT